MADIRLHKHRNGFMFLLLIFQLLLVTVNAVFSVTVTVNGFVIFPLTDISVTVKVNLNHTVLFLVFCPFPDGAADDQWTSAESV